MCNNTCNDICLPYFFINLRPMRSIIALLFLFSSLFCFGMAGFADAFHDFKAWVYPAYLTCLLIGTCILALLIFLSWRFRTRTDSMFAKASEYLRTHRLLGVLVAGVLLAIPLGIAMSALWQLLWFMTICVFMGVIYSFPFALAIGRFRNKFLLNRKMLKWECVLAISAILASVIFIGLIELKLLPFSEDSILARSRSGNYGTSHPWDSLIDIWGTTGLLIVEVIFSFILVLIGKSIRYIYRRFGKNKSNSFDEKMKKDLPL